MSSACSQQPRGEVLRQATAGAAAPFPAPSVLDALEGRLEPFGNPSAEVAASDEAFWAE